MKVNYVNFNSDYQLEKHGNWIDLAVNEDYSMKLFDYKLLDLGIAMELPKWYKAELKPRSSTFKKFGIVQTNSIGEIDTNFSGQGDVWKFPALCLVNSTFIEKGSRIAQFTIKLRDDAPWYMKLKSIFTNLSLVEVDILKGKNRGGFGSTG